MDPLLAERLRGGSGSGADDMPPLPTAAARLAPPNIRALILEKEKELHDINEYRIRTLEGLLRDKESAANGYKQKFAKLQEDFKYNLKLLEGRDEELALYDTNFASLKSALRDRDADVSELKVQLADAQAELKAQQSRGRDQDTFVQQKLKDARAQMDGARWQFDDELRRCRDEAEQAKRKAERRLREQEEDLEAQRREISVAFDEMTRQREVEFKAALDQALGHSRDLELRLKATARESDASRDRLEEAKLKMDNLQQLLHEAEKERKAAEWQLADVRAAKDARIRELEAGAAQLQDVKQALLDEYEAKMAELLQSLHAVESAFVQQKTQYDEELQQHLRRKDDELQSHSLRLESKIVSLTAKLREHEEKYDAAQAELKQLHWDGDAQLLEKDRDVERLKSDLQDLEDEKHALVADSKQQLWQSERALLSLQEKLKDAAVQLQVQREKEKVLRRELAESVETHEELKREIVTLNLRWENKWQDHEQEVSGRRELRERELQHAKDRLIAEKQATEERLVHAENELQRLRTEVFALRTDARIAESFGSAHRRESAPHSRSNGDRAVAAPSPLWSDDHGELSPLVGMSPLLTATPPPATGGGAASATVASLDALQLENAKLRELIREMKDALAQQTRDLSSGEALVGDRSPHEALVTELRESQKRCVLLEAKLVQLEAATIIGGSGQQQSALSAQLAQCQAELADACRTLEAKSARIAELERELAELQRLSQSSGLASERVVADARSGDLRRKLAAAESDIQRLVQERSQLMELSNQLRADLRKLRESSGLQQQSASEFAGKKDFENLVAELSRSLEESRLHNKTLKKELRRMLKLHVGGSGHAPTPLPPPLPVDDNNAGDGSRRRTSSAGTSTASAAHEGRRRSSTLSMMRALEMPSDEGERDGRRRRSVDSGGGDFDAELLTLARNKRSSDSASLTTTSALPERRRSSTRSSLSTADTVRGRTASSVSRPKSIREGDNEDERNEDKDELGGDDSDAATRQPSADEETRSAAHKRSATAGSSGPKSALSSLFQPHDRLADSDAEQHTIEMLLLAGNKAARNASLASFSALGSGGAARSSDRETPSQRSAVARLKELQTRRASMAAERKKVRNYSSVAT